ncbi:MAG: glucose-6-phosphate dehydrogenase assembly protein OpcA [Bacteroidota bacterium]
MSETPAAGRAPSDTTAPFLLLSDEGEQPFDAAALERQLQTMWKTRPQSTAFYRAALANLIVPLGGLDLDQMAPVIAEVSRRHPARILRIDPAPGTPADPARLRARASALCHLREGGGGFVCSEMVVLEYTETTAPLVPSAVRSLLIGDLPAVLLAMTPGPQPSWMEALVAVADLVIADSCVEEEPAALAAIWERTGRKGTPMRDLAWARLEPWRSALARLFDTPEASPALTGLRDLTLAHGGAAPSSTVWLLAGWMASRLGWKLIRRDGTRWTFRSAGGPVQVTLQRDESVAAAVLLSAHVRAAGTHPLDARIGHVAGEDTARLELLAPRNDVRAIPFERRDLATAIVGEMQRRLPNPAFHDAARAARAMIEA